ncbi:acyltransferase family protein [Zavarzinia sp. CC-PAN008]|uniref:acyltransferase family protein n=1 Tax=Zavarzinia sp. CC-PAN008 TaxID=3243332 RepID=UPI003F7462CF
MSDAQAIAAQAGAVPRAARPASGSMELDTSRYLFAVRGFLVFLVVAHHGFDVFGGLVERTPYLDRFMSYDMGTARMASLFLFSGMMFPRLFAKHPRDLLAEKWVPMVHLYVVWTALYCLLVGLKDGALGAVPLAIASELLMPTTPLWFLQQLCIFYVLLWGAMRLGALKVALGAALALLPLHLWLLHAGLLVEPHPVIEFTRYFAAFTLGAATAPWLLRQPLPWPLLVLSLAAITALCVLTPAGEHPTSLVVFAVILIAQQVLVLSLPRRPFLSPLVEPMVAIGKRTLPIYVMHVIFLQGLYLLSQAAGLPDSVAVASVAIVAALLMCLAGEWAAARLGLAHALALKPWHKRHARGAASEA